MREPTMLYKFPGNEQLQDGKYALLTVDADDVDAHAADGWHTTPAAAKSAHEAAQAAALEAAKNVPPTRAELEQKARELGIEFKGSHGDATLAKMIEDKLKA
jgi:hypothetical protein